MFKNILNLFYNVQGTPKTIVVLYFLCGTCLVQETLPLLWLGSNFMFKSKSQSNFSGYVFVNKAKKPTSCSVKNGKITIVLPFMSPDGHQDSSGDNRRQ